MKKIIIDPEIFEKFPEFKRGIIAVEDIKKFVFDGRIEKILNEEIFAKAGKNIVENDIIRNWDDIYLKFGANPNKFPPSIKSLLKRIAKGGKIPFINSVVALFNYISIKYLIPCGGDDADKIEGNFRLGFAKGDENFIPLGSQEKESPEPGEVVYFDDKTQNVMCRRWNWRNGDFSKIGESAKRILINIDGIGGVSKSVIIEARDEMARLLSEYCGAKCKVYFIDKDKKEIEVF